MHLVQILLPMYDNDGRELPPTLYNEVKAELTDRFGGLTAYVRSPAEGRWKTEQKEVRDEIVIYEVMTHSLDQEQAWWRAYREHLQKLFHQGELVVRALPMQLL